jgi:hypothetical protein
MHEAAENGVTSEAVAVALQMMVVAATLGRSTKKGRKRLAAFYEALRAVVDDADHKSARMAGIYPIRGGGTSFGKRPADQRTQLAVEALRRAVGQLDPNRSPASAQ